MDGAETSAPSLRQLTPLVIRVTIMEERISQIVQSEPIVLAVQ